jgi:hypothetical protein
MPDVDFTGTYWASLPLPAFTALLKEKVLAYIDVQDLHGRPSEEHHLSVMLGLPSMPDQAAIDMVKACLPVNITVDQLGYFSNEGWDVLYAKPEVNSTILRLQQGISDCYNVKWHFPQYQPHITIAFLQPGTAEKYVKLETGVLTTTATQVVWKKYKDKRIEPVAITV